MDLEQDGSALCAELGNVHVEQAAKAVFGRIRDVGVSLDLGVEQVEVKVEKPDALRFARSVGVTILRTAGDFRI